MSNKFLFNKMNKYFINYDEVNYFNNINIKYYNPLFPYEKNNIDSDYDAGMEEFYQAFTDYSKNINVKYYPVIWRSKYNNDFDTQTIRLQSDRDVPFRKIFKRELLVAALSTFLIVLSVIFNGLDDLNGLVIAGFVGLAVSFISALPKIESILFLDAYDTDYLYYQHVIDAEDIMPDVDLDELTNKAINEIQETGSFDDPVLKKFLWDAYVNSVNFCSLISYKTMPFPIGSYYNVAENKAVSFKKENSDNSINNVKQLTFKNHLSNVNNDDFNKIEKLHDAVNNSLVNGVVLEKILDMRNVVHLMSDDDKRDYSVVVNEIAKTYSLIINDNTMIDNSGTVETLDSMLKIVNKELDTIINNIESSNVLEAQLSMNFLKEKFKKNTDNVLEAL